MDRKSSNRSCGYSYSERLEQVKVNDQRPDAYFHQSSIVLCARETQSNWTLVKLPLEHKSSAGSNEWTREPRQLAVLCDGINKDTIYRSRYIL
jgi:hypothetical protein